VAPIFGECIGRRQQGGIRSSRGGGSTTGAMGEVTTPRCRVVQRVDLAGPALETLRPEILVLGREDDKRRAPRSNLFGAGWRTSMATNGYEGTVKEFQKAGKGLSAPSLDLGARGASRSSPACAGGVGMGRLTTLFPPAPR